MSSISRRPPQHRTSTDHLVGDAAAPAHGRRAMTRSRPTSRLWLREAIDLLQDDLVGLQRSSVDTAAEREYATVMPGFPHLQVAQPFTFGRHLLAYVEIFARRCQRLADCRRRVNRLPLGLPPCRYRPPDRSPGHCRCARFRGPVRQNRSTPCPIATSRSSSRRSQHRNGAPFTAVRGLILSLSPRFGFIDLPDRFCTARRSCRRRIIRDVPELARGKSARVFGHLVALLALMKAQPLAYNKDNQEDKEPLLARSTRLMRHCGSSPR